jgi:hypothetical protein
MGGRPLIQAVARGRRLSLAGERAAAPTRRAQHVRETLGVTIRTPPTLVDIEHVLTLTR